MGIIYGIFLIIGNAGFISFISSTVVREPKKKKGKRVLLET